MTPVSTHIALTLKGLRKAKGWSLDKAALETGVSKAMLGQIEREESSPTIATLWKIASGFQTSFSAFIEPLSQQSVISKSRGKPENIHPQDDKIRVQTLFAFDPHLKFEIFLLELLPGCEHLSPAHEKGVIEHVITAKGQMEVLIDNSWQTLKEGEGLRFNADQPHGYRNLSHNKAIIHNIIYYP